MTGVCYNKVYNIYGLVFELKEPIRIKEKKLDGRIVNVEHAYKIIYFYKGKKHEEILPVKKMSDEDFEWVLDIGQMVIENLIDNEILNSL